MEKQLKSAIINLAQQPQFKHHQRFVPYHLKIIEQICEELAARYACNRNIVLALVWMHDYSKICNYSDSEWFEKWYALLLDCGYENDLSKQIVDYRKLFEQKMEIDMHTTPIEVQIVSSADAMSHYVWPFFPLYRREHPEKTIEQLMQDNTKKMHKDIDKKVTLPEVKAFLENRLTLFQERQCWLLPKTFFT